jgi:hypothetical protein
MSLLLIIIILILLFGGGYVGYGRYGYQGAGSWVGIVLIVVLILYLTGNLHGLG